MNTIEKRLDKKVMAAIIATAALTFLGIMMETALGIAFPSLMIEFAATSSTIQWLTTGYLLVVASIIPISPLLVKRFKAKRLFQIALIIFTIGTLIAGTALNFPMLLSGRIIQAAGTGIAMPLLFNVIIALIPQEKRGVMMGIAGLIISFAPAIGPTFGGLVVTNLNWHWIFLLILPVLLIAFIVGSLSITPINKSKKVPIDFFSIALASIGLSGIIYGLSIAGNIGWQNQSVLISVAIGCLSILAFIIRQLKLKTPLIDLRVFKLPMFVIGLLNVVFTMMIILCFAFILPLYLPAALNVTPTVVGLIILPGALLGAVLSPICGRILDKKGPRGIVFAGAVVMLLGTLGFVFFTNALQILSVTLLYVVVSAGVAMDMSTSQANTLSPLPADLNPDGTALLNSLQQTAGAIGTALIAGIMTMSQMKIYEDINTLTPDQLTIEGSHNGFIFIAILALINIVFSLFLKNKVRDK